MVALIDGGIVLFWMRRPMAAGLIAAAIGVLWWCIVVGLDRFRL